VTRVPKFTFEEVEDSLSLIESNEKVHLQDDLNEEQYVQGVDIQDNDETYD
jgi:hypothetical protein